jgi:3-hydroxyacyl-CoA dehydrogenase
MPGMNGHVCFAGGGTMGCYNAILSALGGHQATIYDVSDATLTAVPAALAEMAQHLIGAGLAQAGAVGPALARIRTEADISRALDGAWLVSESVFEDISLKRQLFAEIERVCGADVLLTTNSSALLASDIESALTHGDRFAALHSHLGAMLFDIVGGPRTSAANISRLREYVLSLNGFPLVQTRENKGYVFNAMIGPVLSTAMYMVASGAETVRSVDRAWMLRTGAPMGPFGMIDLFGLRLIYDGWHKRVDDPQTAEMRKAILSFLAPIVGSGRLGMRSGSGFYEYPDPAYSRPDFLKHQPQTSSADYALTSAWTQNAVLLAVNKIATPEDIDRAWMVATRQKMGPFGALDEIGVDRAMILFSTTGPMIAGGTLDPLLAFLGAKVRLGRTGARTAAGFYQYPDPAFQAGEFLSVSAING